MAARFLISLDLEALNRHNDGGLEFKTVCFLNRVYFSVSPTTLDKAALLLHDHFSQCVCYINVTSLRNLEDVIMLLDKGASKIIITAEQHQRLDAEYGIAEPGRIIISIDHAKTSESNHLATFKETIQFTSHSVHGFHLQNFLPNSSPTHGDDVARLFSPQAPIYISLTTYTIDSYRIASRDPRNVQIIPAQAVTTDSVQNPSLIPVEILIADAIKTDRPDGLYPTVVVNEHGVCLGLVYSSLKSIVASLNTGRGVYKSRKRNGLWVKGETSGDYQDLVRVDWDCDGDALRFVVRQRGDGMVRPSFRAFEAELYLGFCHLKTETCFGPYRGLAKLEKTLQSRKAFAPPKSYTARLFSDSNLLQAKIMEEASELCEAQQRADIAAEAADLIYFALTKCIASGVSLEDIERDLDQKSMKVTRRPGNAKPKWANKFGLNSSANEASQAGPLEEQEVLKEAASLPKTNIDSAGICDGRIQMRRIHTIAASKKATEADQKLSGAAREAIMEAIQRPSQRSTESVMNIVKPIIDDVRTRGDSALLKYTHKFEKATSLTSPVLRAPYSKKLMDISPETISAIDVSYENIRRFHAAQKEDKPLVVETMPGVLCSRFSKPIERVGLYVPGGTAVLPSTALMLGVPAMVAGCKNIVIASPPRSDGSVTPEIVYIAHKVGAESIVLAGGAQAVAALAYGTETVTKVDKILGPGNQFVTAGKMLVSNDTTAGVSIDMPAGPSEVLVVADKTANPAFVASDLLSQAEHGTDSQVILLAVNLDETQLQAVEDELHKQAMALPRVDIVRGAIEHSVTLVCSDIEEAMQLSNLYAPEHLILQIENAEQVLGMVEHAGSVFVGAWTPESVGDYSAGVNHSLRKSSSPLCRAPILTRVALATYGYAKQYSGVNLGSFMKHITSSRLTEQGLRNVGGAVMQLAKVEELEAHRRAVSLRLEHMDRQKASS